MQLKEFLRISNFEQYSLKIEGDKTSKLVSKDKAFESYSLMTITEIDYGVIFANKGEDYNSHASIIVPRLLLLDNTSKENSTLEHKTVILCSDSECYKNKYNICCKYCSELSSCIKEDCACSSIDEDIKECAYAKF